MRECVRRHRKRPDFKKLLLDHGLAENDYYAALETFDYSTWEPALRNLCSHAAQSIYERDLNIRPPVITHRYDSASGKERDIGCESAMQQVFDFIAVYASMPVFNRRMVIQQASSVEGRGQIYGVRMIRRWAMHNRAGIEYAEKHGYKPKNRMKWFVKLDVSKCFPSCRAEVFLWYFGRDCGNADLLWLWEELLYSHRINGYLGFMIGALTSQWAAQYLLSFAYHYAMAIQKPPRRGKAEKVVSHMVMFMDDMMLCGSSRRQLKRAVESLALYMADSFALTIKPNWHIHEFTEMCGIDMMGFVVYPSGKVAIRARDWVKVRRMILRSHAQQHNVSYKQAKRLTSYKGYLIHSDSIIATGKYRVQIVFRSAQQVVSAKERFGDNHDPSAVQRST